MQTKDLAIELGGSFTLRGQIRNPKTKELVVFTGCSFEFHADDENGTRVTALDATTAGGEFTLEEGDTRFSLVIPDTATTQASFKYATYNLVIIWSDGLVKGLLSGSLSPTRLKR